MLENGVWAISDREDTIRMYPALNMQESVLREGLEIMEDAIRYVEKHGHTEGDAAAFPSGVTGFLESLTPRPLLVRLCHGTVRLFNRGLGHGVGRSVDTGEHDIADRLPCIDPRASFVSPVLRPPRHVTRPGIDRERIAMRPAVNGDAGDIACWIESARAEHAAQLLAHGTLKSLEWHLEARYVAPS